MSYHPKLKKLKLEKSSYSVSVDVLQAQVLKEHLQKLQTIASSLRYDAAPAR